MESLSSGPPASRNTFSVSTITDGYARAGSRSSYLPLRRPDCTSSRLRAEEYDWPVTQPTATPESSSRTIFTLDQALVACWSLECVATPGNRRSYLNVDRSQQACLLPWRTPHCRRLRLAWAGIGEDCRPRTTRRPLALAGRPVLPPLRLTGGIATPTGRYHGRTLIRPSLPCVCHPEKKKVFAHQVRDPRGSAAAC